MHEDGTYVYYQVQANLSVSGREEDRRWVPLDLGLALFERLTFQEARGPRGDEFRALLKPMHDEWQRSGATSAFEREEDARRVRTAILSAGAKRVREVRVARVTEMRLTEAVA